MSEIKTNLENLERSITEVCLNSGRARSEVKILLATKTVSPERINEAVNLGYRLLGENKVQEFLTKYEACPAEWHFIGHLQTNKVKELLGKVSLLHSVDRLALVYELDKRLQKENRKLDILIQVNTSGEESKYGLAPDEVNDFLNEVLKIETLSVKGFMTLAALSSDRNISRGCFKILKAVQISAEEKFQRPFPELSMGMSSDYKEAIEEGATIIRVGTSIFGQRSTSDFYYWPKNN